MSGLLNVGDFETALAGCSSEPVHIPGCIQPHGVLLGYRPEDCVITYLSETAKAHFDLSVRDVLGSDARELLGTEAWHGVQNAATNQLFATARIAAGRYRLFDKLFDIHAFRSGDYVVVECEPADLEADPATYSLSDTMQLAGLLTSGETEREIMETTVRLLRTVSGFDRLMAYRFDQDYNGEVIAEDVRAGLEPYLGLRFPHWDIPEQVRAIMLKSPIRVIGDVDQPPAPIATLNGNMPSLDITLANLRGVSPVHLQYLRNMGTAATMTLSLTIEGRLWGILSFHHRRPRIPPVRVRRLCEAVLPVLASRLQICMMGERIRLFEKIEFIKGQLEAGFDSDPWLTSTFAEFAPTVLDSFRTDGVALLWQNDVTAHGKVPDRKLIENLAARAIASGEKVYASDHIAEGDLPDDAEANGIAGALVVADRHDRAFCLFRQGLDRQVKWAGAPGHEVETVDGMTRLVPRSSFQLYLETVKNRSEPWLASDIQVAASIGNSLIVAWNERRSSTERVRRQQSLMIDELNHRVRNILALVRSISRQARRHNPSLDSYSAALEQRVMALAAAHDIGAGLPLGSISLQQILHVEAGPHIIDAAARLQVFGEDVSVRAEFAPILALVFHELTTNAAKYGALSTASGQVVVDMNRTDGGIDLSWRETGGPAVFEPSSRGFGSSLIEQAVPFELGGGSKLQFDRGGVCVDLFIPDDVLDSRKGDKSAKVVEPTRLQPMPKIPDNLTTGTVLVVEDNFIVANDLAATLRELGIPDVDLAANERDARHALADLPVKLAILDVNLGVHSSNALATEIHKADIPLFFITGYGDRANIPDGLSGCPVLTKPVAKAELVETLAAVMNERSPTAPENAET